MSKEKQGDIFKTCNEIWKRIKDIIEKDFEVKK